MTLGDSRDLSGPQLRYARVVEPVGQDSSPPLAEESLAKALDLARKVEELLEDTRSRVGSMPDIDVSSSGSTHSTRMARAMAASLVDELEVLCRPARSSPRSGVA